MARQEWTVGAGVLLGLLILAVTGRADEATVVRMVEKLGGSVVRDDKRPTTKTATPGGSSASQPSAARSGRSSMLRMPKLSFCL